MANESNSATAPSRARKRRQGQRPDEVEKDQLKERFLESFAKSGNVLIACRSAGVDRSTIYRWAEHDETFALRKQAAETDFFDIAYAEFTRRAIQGYERVVVNNRGIVYLTDDKGKPTKPLMERVVSDRLLEMIIKRSRPEYREKVDVNTTGKVQYDITLPEDPEAAALARALLLRTSSGDTDPSGSGNAR